MKKIGNFLYGLMFVLFFRISSWLCSVPMWLTLILHFVIGLSWKWFIATLIVWLLAGFIRYLLIVFARWGGNSEMPERENKNPYSHKNN
ncbi:MAG: hypothetical protein E7515_04260 [Ruminococcaceae bacterium]|jgi:energy-coupling factor transporter transmembrane protein EcfT|nr:hypothetical protein [Oscillospiraceae bacterium]